VSIFSPPPVLGAVIQAVTDPVCIVQAIEQTKPTISRAIATMSAFLPWALSLR
jgi:hypothetical protein